MPSRSRGRVERVSRVETVGDGRVRGVAATEGLIVGSVVSPRQCEQLVTAGFHSPCLRFAEFTLSPAVEGWGESSGEDYLTLGIYQYAPGDSRTGIRAHHCFTVNFFFFFFLSLSFFPSFLFPLSFRRQVSPPS